MTERRDDTIIMLKNFSIHLLVNFLGHCTYLLGRYFSHLPNVIEYFLCGGILLGPVLSFWGITFCSVLSSVCNACKIKVITNYTVP